MSYGQFFAVSVIHLRQKLGDRLSTLLKIIYRNLMSICVMEWSGYWLKIRQSKSYKWCKLNEMKTVFNSVVERRVTGPYLSQKNGMAAHKSLFFFLCRQSSYHKTSLRQNIPSTSCPLYKIVLVTKRPCQENAADDGKWKNKILEIFQIGQNEYYK